MKLSRVSFFDAFAGIGGFRLGFERLGWQCAGHCEIDAGRREVYRANFKTAGEPEWEDIGTLTSLPQVDVLTAGFPCQPYSMAGSRQGFEDKKGRGALFGHIPRLLKETEPGAFLLENVRGLTTMSWEMAEVLRSLTRSGYSLRWAVLESSNFGAPQRRQRVFFVGFRGKFPVGFRFPKGSWDGRTVRDVMEPDADGAYYAPPEFQRSTELFLPPNWVAKSKRIAVVGRYSPDTYCGWGRVLSPYGLSPTLVPGTDQSGQPLYLMDDATTMRRLTPREWARLQAFPDSFKLPEDDARAYRYLGDSVTTTVAEAVGKEMQRWLG